VTGPFGLPWPTLSALIVILASIVIAVVWAVAAGRGDDTRGDDGE
jgi:hypothetical protein